MKSIIKAPTEKDETKNFLGGLGQKGSKFKVELWHGNQSFPSWIISSGILIQKRETNNNEIL